MLSIVVSLVLQRLDYGNATLVGLPAYQLSRLQSVLNAAARLEQVRPRHTTSSGAALVENWAADRVQALSTRLPLPERPGSVVLILRLTTCVRPGGSSTPAFLVNVDAFLPPVTALSPWLRCGHGTACRDLSRRYLHWRPLDISWRRNCSVEVFLISTALPTISSDRYSVLTLRRTRVCHCL